MDCPICLEIVEVTKNCVVTECGHMFHCACLMKNAVSNGFGCPMCRTAMAEEPVDDSDSDDERDEFESMFSDDSDDEEVEEVDLDFSDLFQEDADANANANADANADADANAVTDADADANADAWSDVESEEYESGSEEEDEEEEEEVNVPNPSDIADFLKSKGVTFEMLLTNALFEGYIGYSKYFGKNECKRSYGIVNNNIEKYLIKARDGRLNDIVRPVKNRVAGSATAPKATSIATADDKNVARIVSEEL
jgi:Ring finger domain